MVVMIATLMCTLGANAQEAYANFTSADHTLTFYYDYLRRSRTGTTYDLNTGTNDPGWRSDNTCGNVIQVVFDPSFANARPTTTYKWFSQMITLRSIKGMEYLNTSAVTNMSWMFAFCSSVFLTTLDLSNFKTSNVTDMSYMFSQCSHLETLDLSHFNTAKVENMSDMFSGCEALTALDLSNINTAKVTDMYSMFSGCLALTTLDLSSFNTSKVTNMGSLFKYDRKLQTIYVGNGWSTGAVTLSTYMFSDCNKLVGGQGTVYNANRVDKEYAHIDGGKGNPGYLTDAATRKAYACYTSENTTLTFYYDHKRNSRTGTTYNLNTGTNNPGWRSDNTCNNVTKVDFDPSFANARPTTTYSWFYSMEKLESITGLRYLNTSEVTNMSRMFSNCYQLNAIDVAGFNTAKVTNMSYMFESCYRLASLDVSHFNTAKVTNMGYMFHCCYCLTDLDVSSFNTSKVTDMSYMFRYCRDLTTLDLSSFNTSYVTDMSGMFKECYKLRTIYVGSGWNTVAVVRSDDMFSSCDNLMGCKLTAYDEEHTDASYAHIDGGPNNPGYLSDPNAPEGYACYTPSNTTLTFYYDTQRRSREGTIYVLNTPKNTPLWLVDDTYASVTQVVFHPSFASVYPSTTCYWFCDMENLESITGIKYLNTSEVTNMEQMFCGCKALTSLDLSSFDTSNVTDMSYMFGVCKSLTTLDLSSFNTANVTKMEGMFYQCESLTTLDLSSFNTAHVSDMSLMFYECENLQTIYVGSSWSTEAVQNGSEMFWNCTNLKGGQGTTFDEYHVDKTYARIDGNGGKGYFTKGSDAYAAFENGKLTFYYDRQRDSRTVTFSLNTDSNLPDWFNDRYYSSVTQVVFDSSFANARPTSTYYWFLGMSYLQSIKGMEYLNTSEVTNMSYMFCGFGLKSLDLSHFNTSMVTDMAGMFEGSKLTTLNLGSFNTANVTSMSSMFRDCSKLVTIYVGDEWNTAKVTSSAAMFQNCTSLVGGQGTEYHNTYPTDKTYARIDGEGGPGYFTDAATGIVTHIEAVPAKANTVKGIYTLDGRKLNELPKQKGIYIVDGRRVVIQ